MKQTIEEQKVSQFYHSLESAASTVVPPPEVDDFILKAAAGKAEKQRKKHKLFIPLSAAASVVIIVTVVLQTGVIRNNSATEIDGVVINKQPMYMLQRAKPATADEMIQHVKQLLDEGNIEQARELFIKFKTRYPEYKLRAGLSEKLK
ncbi:MAG: hypothetical protein OEY29_00360 [Gammaproteobacteria bacterium]|nr:hypothetical protein [Gammaproteobacteria bacterium]